MADDADGDVLRRLESQGFDFSRHHTIDFQVDLQSWPPAPEAVALMRETYPNVFAVAPEADFPGYLQISVCAPLTYELVTAIQVDISRAMSVHGGTCTSWGVLH